jgi:hypothetical protein
MDGFCYYAGLFLIFHRCLLGVSPFPVMLNILSIYIFFQEICKLQMTIFQFSFTPNFILATKTVQLDFSKFRRFRARLSLLVLRVVYCENQFCMQIIL